MIFCNGGFFVHIPKTAGTSIAMTLMNSGPAYVLKELDHMKIYPNGYLHYKVEPWVLGRDIWIYTFVRNPWERLLSWYAWEKSKEPFRTFVTRALVENKLYHALQSNYLRDYRFDFIGRFENLVQDWEVVRKRLKAKPLIKQIGRKGWHRHYSRYYTDDLIELVRTFESPFLEQFPYEFEDKRDARPTPT